MATLYMIADGHDVPPESMSPFDPQPRTEGMQYTRRQYAASGIVVDEAPFVEFLWSMFETGAQYRATLTQAGVLVARTALVSLYLEDDTFDGIVRNATIVRPFIGSDGKRTNYWLADFVLLAKNLQAQA